MGSKERRERERQEVRDRILEAARELFAREGYEAVSMRRLAEKIEYSPTALYLHFEDKDALFMELCRIDFLALAEKFQRLAHVPDPVERLRFLGREYVRFGVEHPNHYRLMFMTVHPRAEGHPEDLEKGNPDQDAYAFLLATVRECVDGGRFRPELDDVHALAQMLWGAVHGIVALHVTMGRDEWVELRPAGEVAVLATDTMVRGLLRES